VEFAWQARPKVLLCIFSELSSILQYQSSCSQTPPTHKRRKRKRKRKRKPAGCPSLTSCRFKKEFLTAGKFSIAKQMTIKFGQMAKPIKVMQPLSIIHVGN
jgi:hypothetical protein